jgi:hypothetical protein
MSDLPFCAAICVLFAADTESPLGRRRLITMAIAGAAAFTFRMARWPAARDCPHDCCGLVANGSDSRSWRSSGRRLGAGDVRAPNELSTGRRNVARLVEDPGRRSRQPACDQFWRFERSSIRSSNGANDIPVVELLLRWSGPGRLRAGPQRFAHIFALSRPDAYRPADTSDPILVAAGAAAFAMVEGLD